MTFIEIFLPVVIGALMGFVAINPMLTGCCIDSGIQWFKRFLRA